MDKCPIVPISKAPKNLHGNNGNLDSAGFDRSAGCFYFYPIDFPVRSYQKQIITQCLIKNVLVCLPTGLGKTFIAAVVMLNYHRWFPNNLIVFIAPTRPLVHQQYRACLDIGSLRHESVECLTGVINTTKRACAYEHTRVLFTTPQILTNDIAHGFLNPRLIKCLIIDEAHKATKNHAYCQLVRAISNIHVDFRVVALTASPGESLDVIQNLINNLNLNIIEYFDEDHSEVAKYVKNKCINEIVLNFNNNIYNNVEKNNNFDNGFGGLLDSFTIVVNDILKKCAYAQLLTNPAVGAWSAYRIRVKLNLIKEGGRDIAAAQPLYVAQFLVAAYERLAQHGVIPCVRSLFTATAFPAPAAISHLKMYPDTYNTFLNIYNFTKNSFGGIYPYDDLIHPKILYMLDILKNHFKNNNCGRVIIFSSYRDSVDEIVAILNNTSNIYKVMNFVGQADSKTSKGLKQKEQLEALEKFRNGDFNILVSTSVGEEGLDIGEVKLIIFYDVSSSPLRLIQRMGRTGRKEAGSIFILMMKGVEQSHYQKGKNKSKLMTKVLTNKISQLIFNEPSRIIPPDINPICVLAKISNNTFNKNINIDTTKSKSKKSKKSLSDIDDDILENNFNIDLNNFKKPKFDIAYFHILGSSIFHSIKSHAIHSIFTRNPKFTSSTYSNKTAFNNFSKNNNKFSFNFSDSDFDDINFKTNLNDSNNLNVENNINNDKDKNIDVRNVINKESNSESDFNFDDKLKNNFSPENVSNNDYNFDINFSEFNSSDSDIFVKSMLKNDLNIDKNDSNTNELAKNKVDNAKNADDANNVDINIFKNLKNNFTGNDSNSNDFVFNNNSNNNSSENNLKNNYSELNFYDTNNFNKSNGCSDKFDIDINLSNKNKIINIETKTEVKLDSQHKNDKNSVIEVICSSDNCTQEKLEESIIKPSVRKRLRIKSSESVSPSKKQKTLGRQMLLTQAEVVDSASSDTEVTDSEKVNDSFINDELETSSFLVPNTFHRQSLFSPDASGFKCENAKYKKWKSVVDDIEHKYKAGEYDSNSLIPETSEETFLTAETQKSSIPSDELIDLDCFNVPTQPAVHVSEVTEATEETTIDERQVLLVDSSAFAHSQIPSLLRNKYSFELLNIPELPFHYIIGKTIAVDIIKSSNIASDQTKIQKSKKYSDSSLYSKMYIILQNDINDKIDMSTIRIKAIQSLYRSSSPLQTIILYSNNQEKTASMIADLASNIDEKQIIPKLNIDSISSTKLMKLASSISRLGIVPPTIIIELLVAFGSLGNFLRDGTPELFKKYSKNITGIQAQSLYQVLERQIFRNNS